MNLARGREYSAMERSIDVQISRLRRMVEEDPAHPRYIQTVWGLGYVFVPDGSKARRLRFSPRSSFARTLLLIVTLLFASAGDDSICGAELRDFAEPPAVCLIKSSRTKCVC